MKRITKQIVIILLLCLMLPRMVAYANSPPPARWISLELNNLPDSAIYADTVTANTASLCIGIPLNTYRILERFF
jgi:hypothetical protein